jgi:hypothetical protein
MCPPRARQQPLVLPALASAIGAEKVSHLNVCEQRGGPEISGCHPGCLVGMSDMMSLMMDASIRNVKSEASLRSPGIQPGAHSPRSNARVGGTNRSSLLFTWYAAPGLAEEVAHTLAPSARQARIRS